MNGLDAALLNFSPTMMMILNAVLAIVMFSIAIDLRPSDFARLRQAPKPLLVGLASQFLLLPMLTFTLVCLSSPPPSIALGLILVAACPGGNISNFITHRAGGNAALSVSMTAVATVAAIVLTPLNIAFWGGLYPPTRLLLKSTSIDPAQIAVTVGLMLILPLISGMALNQTRPELTRRIRRPLQSLSMGIFIAFILVAVAGNWTFLQTFASAAAGLVIVHNALALSGGWGAASLARLSPYDRRAIMIETGIQNSGLGLVLIFGFFGGLGGMALTAAFWGIWHGISGLILARFLSRTEASR